MSRQQITLLVSLLMFLVSCKVHLEERKDKEVFQLPLLLNPIFDLDSNVLVTKAKLLSLSHYGGTDIEGVLKDLDKMAHQIHKSKVDPNYEILEIHYYKSDEYQSDVVSTQCCDPFKCTLVIAYSPYSGRFFKVSGYRITEYGRLRKELGSMGLDCANFFSEVGKDLLDVDCYENMFASAHLHLEAIDKCSDLCDVCRPCDLY